MIAVLARETAPPPTAEKTDAPDLDHEGSSAWFWLRRMAEGRPGDWTDCSATDKRSREAVVLIRASRVGV